MVKRWIHYHNCQLSDFVDLVTNTDTKKDNLAIITLNCDNRLTLHVLDGNQTPVDDTSYGDHFDCLCYKNLKNKQADTKPNPSFWHNFRHYFHQRKKATDLLLLHKYSCSCIKTKMLLMVSLIDKFGIHDAFSRFNRVFHAENLHAPLTNLQLISLL